MTRDEYLKVFEAPVFISAAAMSKQSPAMQYCTIEVLNRSTVDVNK